MLSFSRKSIFDPGFTGLLVNPVNCVGTMGKGLAKEFSLRFPGLLADYRRECLSGRLSLGGYYFWFVPGGQPLAVVNLPTKRHWREGSAWEPIAESLARITDVLMSCGEDVTKLSLACPKLGCGLGGLAWAEVRPRLVHSLTRLGTVMDVTICE